MREFELNTKIDQKVFRIYLNVRSEDSKHNSSTYHPDGKFIKELKIVFQTDYKIALSDDFITLLNRKEKGKTKDYFHMHLEDINVSILTKETYFPNGIFSTCYTTKNPEKVIPKMKKAMLEKIQKEYGFLIGNEVKQQIEQL